MEVETGIDHACVMEDHSTSNHGGMGSDSLLILVRASGNEDTQLGVLGQFSYHAIEFHTTARAVEFPDKAVHVPLNKLKTSNYTRPTG